LGNAGGGENFPSLPNPSTDPATFAQMDYVDQGGGRGTEPITVTSDDSTSRLGNR